MIIETICVPLPSRTWRRKENNQKDKIIKCANVYDVLSVMLDGDSLLSLRCTFDSAAMLHVSLFCRALRLESFDSVI